MLIILLYFLEFYNRVTCLHIDGYYWRDFYNKTPYDAFLAGYSNTGEAIYVGQTLFRRNLLPAKIYGRGGSALFGFDGKEHCSNKNIKILCTPFPERLKWLPTSSDEIHLLTEHHIILGGLEPGLTMYIGRTYYNSGTHVGKISVGRDERNNRGLYITNDGKEINLKKFEILTYSPYEGVNEIVCNGDARLCQWKQKLEM